MFKLIVATSVLLLILWSPPATAAPQGDLVDDLLRLQPGQRPEAMPVQNARPNREAPPPDDAPLEALTRFWAPSQMELQIMQFRDESMPTPSDKTRERLMEAVIADPQTATSLLKLLPRNAAVHDRLKRLYDENVRLGESWRDRIRRFLMENSTYFRDDLIRLANDASDQVGIMTYVRNEEALAALANLDWPLAEPLLKRFAKGEMPRRAILAKTILYAHYPEGPDANRLNAELRKTVADPSALAFVRIRALQALLDRSWPGRVEWFLVQFRDSSLREVREGNGIFRPLAQQVRRDPDRWIPVVAPLVGNTDRAVHDNAVTCLIQFQNERARRDALEPLLPWLLDPTWASDRDRLRLIQSMKVLNLRESIPGLIAVLNQGVQMSERGYAADALAHFRDPRAIPELQRALPVITGDYRQMFVAALAASGGLPDAAVVSGLEAYARTIGSEEASMQLVAQMFVGGRGPADQAIVGLTLAAQGSPPAETAIALLLARATELEKTDRLTAEQLLALTFQWQSPTGDRDLVQRIETDRAPAPAIYSALRRRNTFSRNTSEAFRASAPTSGISAGILAVLLVDSRRELDILKGSDTAAIRALLASARLASEALPLDTVERVYIAGDAGAQRAAEAYLMSDDSPRARVILNAKLKGTIILGFRSNGDPGPTSNSGFDQQEANLLAFMKGENADDEVFALLSWAYPGRATQIVIRRRGDTATVASQDATGSKNSRTLSADEFNKMKAFIDSQKIDDLGPLEQEVADGVHYEYVHLTRSAGRRVSMSNPGLIDTNTIYDKLLAEFHRLVR